MLVLIHRKVKPPTQRQQGESSYYAKSDGKNQESLSNPRPQAQMGEGMSPGVGGAVIPRAQPAPPQTASMKYLQESGGFCFLLYLAPSFSLWFSQVDEGRGTALPSSVIQNYRAPLSPGMKTNQLRVCSEASERWWSDTETPSYDSTWIYLFRR